MKKILLFLLLFIYANTVKAQNESITHSGDIIQIALPVVALGSTFIWNDDDTKPTWQLLKAYGTGLVIQQALKRIVLKPRPDGTDNYSFPSGHTTSAFSGAAFIQKRYGWKYGIPSYLLASFVGYSRIQAKKHDGWDVLGGAVVGISTSYFFTKRYEKKNIEVSINKNQDGQTLCLLYTF
ncbi:phosphatase PAP2 family protein [Flavobacterium sp.]|uniref:phosphatase PAP2 family protein n=1 Tax=Flavobacterium sp. TaxID=239 RepID=UPI003C4E2201